MGHHGQSPGPKAEPCSRSQRGPCPAQDAVREVQTMTRLWIEEGIGLYLKLLSFHQLLAVANVTQSERHHACSQGSAGPWRSPSPVLLPMFLTKYKACSITVHPVHVSHWPETPSSVRLSFPNPFAHCFSATQAASVHKHTAPCPSEQPCCAANTTWGCWRGRGEGR